MALDLRLFFSSLVANVSEKSVRGLRRMDVHSALDTSWNRDSRKTGKCSLFQERSLSQLASRSTGSLSGSVIIQLRAVGDSHGSALRFGTPIESVGFSPFERSSREESDFRNKSPKGSMFGSTAKKAKGFLEFVPQGLPPVCEGLRSPRPRCFSFVLRHGGPSRNSPSSELYWFSVNWTDPVLIYSDCQKKCP